MNRVILHIEEDGMFKKYMIGMKYTFFITPSCNQTLFVIIKINADD